MRKTMMFALVLVSGFTQAQNMVKNPEMKTVKKPNTWAQIDKAEGWSDANGATADLFQKGSGKTKVGIDENYIGTQAAEGNNYAGIITCYDDQRINLLQTATDLDIVSEKSYGKYAEYLQGEITEGLVAGKSYTFSFKVSLAEGSSRAVKGLGVHFSNEKLSYSTNGAIDLVPQVVSSELIRSTDGWVEVKGTFVAKGGEKYFSIGAFKGSYTAEKTVADGQNDSKKAYYYIQAPNLVPAGGGRTFADFEDIKLGKKVIFLTLNFETGKSNITPDSYAEIDACANFLKNNPELKIQIDGHTDAVGSAEVNQKLSEDRSIAVKEYLVGKGVSNGMQTAGYGETKPLDTSGGESNPKNRRIELYLAK